MRHIGGGTNGRFVSDFDCHSAAAEREQVSTMPTIDPNHDGRLTFRESHVFVCSDYCEAAGEEV